MYLRRLRISGVRGFHGPREAGLSLDAGPGFVVVAGRNGSGKTTLLRAIAAALAGPQVANSLTEGDRDWVSHGRPEATVHADVVTDGTPVTARLKWVRHEDARPRPEADGTEPLLWSPRPSGLFAAGYGPFRRLAATGGEVARLMAGDWTTARFVTLFREEASLAETVPWLQQVNYRAGSGSEAFATLERRVIGLLNDGLFPDGYAVDRVDPDGLWITRHGGEPIRVDEMSDGYRTVTALITDIVRQLQQCYNGRIPWHADAPVVDAPGIVLIDEIDAHLHVSWQKRIAPWLLAHFPAVQFIVTSHSPYICQSASANGLIQLPGPFDASPPRVADEALFRRVAYGSGDDAVLTELFGLDSPYSERADALRARVTDLERRAIRGEATPADLDELTRLADALSPSPSSRVRDVLGDDT